MVNTDSAFVYGLKECTSSKLLENICPSPCHAESISFDIVGDNEIKLKCADLDFHLRGDILICCINFTKVNNKYLAILELDLKWIKTKQMLCSYKVFDRINNKYIRNYDTLVGKLLQIIATLLDVQISVAKSGVVSPSSDYKKLYEHFNKKVYKFGEV